MHHIVQPFTLVPTIISPDVNSLAFDVVVDEIAIEVRVVVPLEGAVAELLAKAVLALVAGAVGPRLMPLPVLFIACPHAFVARAICMHINAEAICHIVDPLARVVRAISVHDAALPVVGIVDEVAFIRGAILPNVDAMPLAYIGANPPLPSVFITIFEQNFVFELQM